MYHVLTTTQAQHSPGVGATGNPQYYLAGVLDRLACWVRACRDGTVGCLQGFFDGIQDMLEAALSIFRVSGKDQVPRSEL